MAENILRKSQLTSLSMVCIFSGSLWLGIYINVHTTGLALDRELKVEFSTLLFLCHTVTYNGMDIISRQQQYVFENN